MARTLDGPGLGSIRVFERTTVGCRTPSGGRRAAGGGAMMLPRRVAPTAAKQMDKLKEQQKKKPTMDEFIGKADWSGALGLLQFERNTQISMGAEESEDLIMWMAYCAFHLGDYKRAAEHLDELINYPQAEPVWNLYKACCLFYLGSHKEA